MTMVRRKLFVVSKGSSRNKRSSKAFDELCAQESRLLSVGAGCVEEEEAARASGKGSEDVPARSEWAEEDAAMGFLAGQI